MRIGGIYSFNNGRQLIEQRYPNELREIREVIASIDAETYKTKISKEKTMPGKVLYSPTALNTAIKSAFKAKGDWKTVRVQCDYPAEFFEEDYEYRDTTKGAFREMDFVKDGLGVEVQFGKYAFMVYNVCAKMTIFNKLGFITHGIEIVPMKVFQQQMSTGVSYYEQFVWDLAARGAADIDIPVLIIGIYAGALAAPVAAPDLAATREDRCK